MSEERYRKLGAEKQKEFDKDFDNMLVKYQQKALEAGLTGELKFVKERGKVIIFIVI
jgi:hypothetical protein